MRQIVCVVFDIGNVLVRWDPRNLYRRMGYADAAMCSIMAETGLPDINHRLLDAGAPYGATIAELANRFPQHAEFILAFDTRWAEMLDGAIEQNVAVLRRLKRGGFPVHAVSNFSREKFNVARRLFPVLDEFDELIISGDVGTVKPDPEIFQILIDRRNLEPGQTLFIDDAAENIAAACRIGFDTVLFKPGETDLYAELVSRGVGEDRPSGGSRVPG